MSTTPDEPGGSPSGPPAGSSGDRPSPSPMGYTIGNRGDLARMPIPGNAEMVYVVLASILVAILAWVADGISDNDWLFFFLVVSAAYLLSRGIAKASRVLEQ